MSQYNDGLQLIILNTYTRLFLIQMYLYNMYISGADPGFQVRGGALKKIAPSGGGRENCWGISCEKSRFYAKKSYFSQLRRGRENL